MTKPLYYVGAPETCNICEKPFKNMMYDAKIPGSSWGNLCKPCFKSYGCKLGTGMGQEYTRVKSGCETPGQCEKIAHLPFVSKQAVDALACRDGCELVGRWLKTGG